MKGKVRVGPAASFLAAAYLDYVRIHRGLASCSGVTPGDDVVFGNRVAHIVEEPGGIRYLTECEVPTEEYNDARSKDLARRYPNMSAGVLEHLDALEPI